ncbi:MAG: cell division protein ZapA [Clostridia bacterium]|nr:cell division protein ZapA [Clostridia bacterium]
MDKQKMTVRVAGKEYTLVSSDGAEHLQRVAAYVDRRITETMYAARMTRENVAVLTAMNITDELMKAQDENARLRRELNALREAKD